LAVCIGDILEELRKREMQKYCGKMIYSASDIVNFSECEHITTLDMIDLDTPLPRAEETDEMALISSKGYGHEGAYSEKLKHKSGSFVDIASFSDDMEARAKETVKAINNGVEIIYQATLYDGKQVGHADFLRRVETPSSLGSFSYEVIDAKLSKKARAKFIIQLCFYSEMIAGIQRKEPAMMRLVLGDGREEGFRYLDYARYYGNLKKRFLSRIGNRDELTYPEPCGMCGYCKWRDLCNAKWIEDDHLCQVAGINKTQINKLRVSGINTLQALANLPENHSIQKIAQETFSRLRHQASLQLLGRETNSNQFDILPDAPDKKRGFYRLPKPDKGDLFFDMEGDPLEDEGLEYLFGLYYFDNDNPIFKPFWGHNKVEEKKAFEDFMDFLSTHLKTHPQAHIYHYASYEESALKRLMSYHGTREAEVDNLLRKRKLVDLYKVVREGIRVSEPRYSLKNIEKFYMDCREGEVKSAGASIVYYEKWKESKDPSLIKEIEDYNKVDCQSTYLLREWLLKIRPDHLPWFDYLVNAVGESSQANELTEAEARLLSYQKALVDPLPLDRNDWTKDDYLKELTFFLLDFHRRADKPAWWAMFSRMEMSEDELIDDVECIGGMTIDKERPPYPDKQSIAYTFLYPEQEFKLKNGDGCVRTDTGDIISNLIINEDNRRVTFRYAKKREPMPEKVSIGPGGPIRHNVLKDAVFRFADSVIAADDRYMAIKSLLKEDLPIISGHTPETPIIQQSNDAMSKIIDAVSNLESSFILIQGPPGAGKTYTGSHIIVDLLMRKYRIGVSSNSHKAINNLLSDIERVAQEKGFSFRGVKKNTSKENAFGGKLISDVTTNPDVIDGDYQLIAGTSFLFSREEFDQSLDFIFVDEAGQVALANLIALGTSARNIVLLGDQMQLGQPVQGVHPGRSGESSLDYIMREMATVPLERGIFLDTTWRMNPDICKFISDAIYEGRLLPEAANANQRLILDEHAHHALKPTGISYVPVEHEGCRHRSEEETLIVKNLYESLLSQKYSDRDGSIHDMTSDNILIVAPYNMQVNLLKETLPENARIGTVDKFQGQQAEVVIVSMTTSSGDDLPRNIEFLYSKNRLNVAVSRARCLSVIIANPRLMSIKCNSIEQMALVNTLCWAKDYSELKSYKERN